MTEPSASTVRDEPGGVVDRRRFVPSPPCLPPGADPPAGAVSLNDVPDDRQMQLLPFIAAAIDKIHRYRVAHGSLNPKSLFVEGTSIWIVGVGPVWNEAGERGSPRERDLAWFRKECERWHGPSVQPGIGKTCQGMLAAWREPPPARTESPSRNGRAPAAKTIPRKSRRRRRIPWKMISVVAVVVTVVGGVAAWQLTPLPRYTYRTLRWGFRKLPVSARIWIDPDGKFDPVGRRLRLEEMQTQWSRLELGLGMQRPESMIEVLTEPGDDYTDLLRRFLRTNDPGFLTTLSSMYLFGGAWTPKSVPRLKELLGEELPHGARRTLQYCFLRSSSADDLAMVESILQTPEHPDIVAEAYLALARLGRPAPIEKLVQACSEASHNASLRFITAVLHFYSQDEGQRFLKAYSTSRRRKSLAEAWHHVMGVVETSPEGAIRNRASKTFERTLFEVIPKTLAVSGPAADADLLTTLLCLWRLQTVSPEVLMKRLSEPPPQGSRIWSRLSAMLVGDGANPPDELTLPDAWEIPDEWFAAVLAVNQDYPEPFVRKVLFNRSDLRPHQKESRLLALSNINSDTGRHALAADVSRSLLLYSDTWRTKSPQLISSICALLAAAGDKAADDALNRFLAPGPYGREFPAWDGLIVGAIVDPARHRALLKIAATHPLPSVWTRARQTLALAEGNVEAFRNPDLRGPELPQALTSLVDQFESAVSEADVFVIISRQRAAQLAEFALGLSGSPGAVAVLHARMDRSESQLSTHLLLANQPVPLDRRRFDEFLRSEPPYQVFDPPIMIGHVLRNDLRSLETFRALAVGPRSGRNSPPLLHRFIAMECYGALQTASAPPGTVLEILSVVDRDASVLVRHAAAAAALRCVKKEDKALLLDFAAKHPELPRGVADILNLAGKL